MAKQKVSSKKKKKRSTHKSAKIFKHKKTILSLLCIFIFLVFLFPIYISLSPAVHTKTILYIPTKATYTQVCDSLEQKKSVRMFPFKMIAKLKSYSSQIKPGHYIFERGSSALTIVNRLRSGSQDPIKLTFNRVRTIEELSVKLASQIEADSLSISTLLHDDVYLYPLTIEEVNLTPENVLACFVPNTYYVFWNLSAEDLLKRMYKEQDKFWTTTRKEKAKKMGLNRIQVMTMASIVEQETEDKKEKADIASVYLNRLRKGMLLQADPTVKFAIGDFGLKRILQVHLQSNSPFNTYKYKGLPPGPICTPSSYSIDAVLQNKQTPYFYFCAKEDFSGTHAFAATYAQHQANAKAYHRALDQKAIK